MTNTEKQKRTVLIVDADVEDRLYACMLLQRFGYDVVSASSTERAFEFMTVARPSAIVADGDRTGPTLLPRLTQDPRFFDTPLILASWWPNRDLEERAGKGEFAASMRKPIDVIQLYRTLQLALEKGPRRNLRISVHLRTVLKDGIDENEGYASAISEYGMFFRTLKPRAVNTTVPVVIVIRDREIQSDALVLYTVPFEEGPFSEPGMGMKFLNMSRRDREYVAAFILDRIGEGIRQGSPDREA